MGKAVYGLVIRVCFAQPFPFSIVLRCVVKVGSILPVAVVAEGLCLVVRPCTAAAP